MWNILKKQRGMNIVGQGGKIILFMLPSLVAAIWVHTALPRVAALPPSLGAVKPAGYVLLLLGLILWAMAVIQLLTGFPKGKLVTSGAYGVVRNPIYSSVIFFILPGVALLTLTWVYFVAAAFLYAGVMILIGVEEKQLARAIGQAYEDYLARVHRRITINNPSTPSAKGGPMHDNRSADWRRSLGEAIPIAALILGLFYYWFAVADRYATFLYGHSALNMPLAQPFDPETSSRYWMAGLVAAAVVMILDVAANWLRGRVAAWRKRALSLPSWRQVWALAALPILIGVPLITMTVNAPTLPLGLAAACAASALLGLIPALLAGRWAAERPAELAWLAADGAALAPTLLFLRVLELPGRGLSFTPAMVRVYALAVIAVSVVGLGATTLLRRWRRKRAPGVGAVLLAGLGCSYVLAPLLHHVAATPAEYRYITSADNFFAVNPALQLLALAVATGLAALATLARRRWR